MDKAKKALYERATELDIKGRGEMSAEELEAAVYAAEDDDPTPEPGWSPPEAPETVDPATDEAPEPEAPVEPFEPAYSAEADPEYNGAEDDAPAESDDGADHVEEMAATLDAEDAESEESGVRNGDTVIYIDGNGAEHDAVVELVDPDAGTLGVRVGHELLVVERGTDPGTWKPKE